eukprot:ctg_1387.g445
MHLERCVRVMPHDQNTGGFFVAVLRRLARTGREDAEMENGDGDASGAPDAAAAAVSRGQHRRMAGPADPPLEAVADAADGASVLDPIGDFYGIDRCQLRRHLYRRESTATDADSASTRRRLYWMSGGAADVAEALRSRPDRGRASVPHRPRGGAAVTPASARLPIRRSMPRCLGAAAAARRPRPAAHQLSTRATARCRRATAIARHAVRPAGHRARAGSRARRGCRATTAGAQPRGGVEDRRQHPQLFHAGGRPRGATTTLRSVGGKSGAAGGEWESELNESVARSWCRSPLPLHRLVPRSLLSVCSFHVIAVGGTSVRPPHTPTAPDRRRPRSRRGRRTAAPQCTRRRAASRPGIRLPARQNTSTRAHKD